MILELQDVAKSYQMDGVAVHALQGVSLKIKKGELASIMGPSGSGKSTLMHIMGLLDTPTSGKVFFQGKDISRFSEEELARLRNKSIGFVFQAFNLLPRTSSLHNVALPLLYSGKTADERAALAKRALERVGLGERLGHTPAQLSGGEQQRVAIARALVANPSIILADEPTGNLDTKSGKEIMRILQTLNREGHTIVVVTHEQHIARYAKRVIKMLDGRIKDAT